MVAITILNLIKMYGAYTLCLEPKKEEVNLITEQILKKERKKISERRAGGIGLSYGTTDEGSGYVDANEKYTGLNGI